MDYPVKTAAPSELETPCLVLGVFSDRLLTPAAQQMDQASGGHLSQVLQQGDLEGDVGQSLLLYQIPGSQCQRVLLMGLGEQEKFNLANLRKAVAGAVALLNNGGSVAVAFHLDGLVPAEADTYATARELVLTADQTVYRFDELKSDPKAPKSPLQEIALGYSDAAVEAAVRRGVAHAQAIGVGVRMARDLGNLPGNVCTPSYLADQAQRLAKDVDNLKLEVLDQEHMEELEMGALLSVARGSRQPPKLIVLDYRGGEPDSKPVVLVGKGVTFDSGGISIKPAKTMDEMKFDMCGAAAVLGTFSACLQLGLPVNLVGVIPATENLPDGNASKPGDIVTSLSKQTIEILNTDAEGRLILCDALTYSERFDPDVVIDLATLTGACVVALGKHASGLFTSDDPLAEALLRAGEHSVDRAWRMPLWDDYQPQLDSNFADMANIGGPDGGAITAACFLSRFTNNYRWAHLDIAGAAWKSGDEKGATGRPVALLTQFLLNRLGG
jgi:leucyl aminopeptidase